MPTWPVWALLASTVLWGLTLATMVSWIHRLRRRLKHLDSAKRSQSTRYGQIAEQFIPLTTAWRWDPKRFRFLGDPIDGIQFTDEGVILVEVKSAGSRLSTVQRQVRDHVRAGRVTWEEVRVG